MAETLYGHVYFHEFHAGVLSQEANRQYTFTYHPGYVESGQPAIAYTLPLSIQPIFSDGLHPYFDNLVAEGWLAHAQARALGIQRGDRFARLLAFGHDCIGAISVRDPRPRTQPDLDSGTPEELAALASRASISGVQPKFLAVRTHTGYRPARAGESSTHIAKLPSGQLAGVAELEYLTTLAAAALLTEDRIAEMEISRVTGVTGECLLVKRFDRTPEGGKIHFEEFNQLLNRPAEGKYDGSYSEMADFLRRSPRCDTADIDRLFRRVLAGILMGNNDAHMKNFALLYEDTRMRLTPVYDFVAAALYPDYNSSLALRIGRGPNPRTIGDLKAKHIEELAKSFGLGRMALLDAVHDLGARMNATEEAVQASPAGKPLQKKQLIEYMRKRWNGTFRSIGRKS